MKKIITLIYGTLFHTPMAWIIRKEQPKINKVKSLDNNKTRLCRKCFRFCKLMVLLRKKTNGIIILMWINYKISPWKMIILKIKLTKPSIVLISRVKSRYFCLLMIKEKEITNL